MGYLPEELTKVCTRCETSFPLKRPDNRVTLCPNCASKREPSKTEHPIIKCALGNCSKMFKQANITHKYCCTRHRSLGNSLAYQATLVEKAVRCAFCNKGFVTTKNNKKYCCEVCYKEAKLQRIRRVRLGLDAI